MKLITILIAAVILSGCNEEEYKKDEAAAKAALPTGCEMIDIGSYKDIKRLVFVVCDERRTETSIGMYEERTGKTTYTREATSVVIYK